VEEVLHLFTRRLRPLQSFDGLTPILLDEAHAGDLIAHNIVQKHGWALGNYALAAARMVGIEGTAFTLVLAGGVFRHHSPLLADVIIEKVRTTSPAIRPTRPRFEPIIGVLFTVLEAAGVVVDDVLLERLIPTIPGATLFSTVLDYSG
jgi:N-acetylglucosamine kinase-like BadF-type ATPase